MPDLSSNDSNRYLRPLVAIIAIILLLAGMKATSVVTMPLGFAIFIVMLAWPLQVQLERKLHTGLSLFVTLLVIVAVFALFVYGMMFCVDAIAEKVPKYEQRFTELVQESKGWIREKKLPIQPEHFDPKQAVGRVVDALGSVVKGAYDIFGVFVLVAVFLVLGLLEVRAFRYKLENRVNSPNARKVVHATIDVATSIQRFMLTRTLISGITGILVGLYSWAIGLDFPVVWGISSFLLNYVPVLGSIIAVIPPSLVALLDPQAVWLFPATLAGLSLIQFTLGNYVEPLVQGRYLSLSPLVLFFSLVFWSWVWGIPGALLGVPLTIAIVIYCRHFESTRWIAELLATHESHLPAASQKVNREDTNMPVEMPGESSKDLRERGVARDSS